MQRRQASGPHPRPRPCLPPTLVGSCQGWPRPVSTEPVPCVQPGGVRLHPSPQPHLHPPYPLTHPTHSPTSQTCSLLLPKSRVPSQPSLCHHPVPLPSGWSEPFAVTSGLSVLAPEPLPPHSPHGPHSQAGAPPGLPGPTYTSRHRVDTCPPPSPCPPVPAAPAELRPWVLWWLGSGLLAGPQRSPPHAVGEVDRVVRASRRCLPDHVGVSALVCDDLGTSGSTSPGREVTEPMCPPVIGRAAAWSSDSPLDGGAMRPQAPGPDRGRPRGEGRAGPTVPASPSHPSRGRLTI